MELNQINLYRITHIDNVSHVIKNGITHKSSSNSNSSFVSIGDTSLIDYRSDKSVRIDNGNSNFVNAKNIILGEFIPFYFGVRMPMLYVIQNGGNLVDKATKAENIIYIVCPVKTIIDSSSSFYFSDGHATDGFTSFYDQSKVDELPSLINWEAIKTSYWGGDENLNLKREKQAEFLVQSDIPYNIIASLDLVVIMKLLNKN